MPIGTISNGEAGSSVRSKLNSTIGAVNALGDSSTLNVGSTAGTVCAGDDARLSDSREWTASTISQAEAEAGTSTTRRAFTAQRVFQAIAAWWATITDTALRTKAGLGDSATLNVGTTAGTVAAGDDSRLTNSRTPTAHASSHVSGGSDEIRAATASVNGLMTAAFASKLDGIEAGAQVNVATNLSYTAATRLLESSTGTDVTLPLVTSTAAGLAPLSGGGTSNFLRADGTWAAPSGSSGKVLQIVQATKTDTATVTGTTFASVFPMTITPTSATSQVIVMAMLSVGNAASNIAFLRLTRASSTLIQGDTAGNRTRITASQLSGATNMTTVPILYMDSPASTSLQTYNIELASHSTGAVYLNRTATDTDSVSFSRGASSIILIEVAP
jgi:hypothetical protein